MTKYSKIVSSQNIESESLRWQNDYYSFGMLMPERSFSSPAYRFGFNGMEKDDEVKGEGNSLDFGSRVYDSRIGKFLSVDPLIGSFPFQSSYCFAGNSPVKFIDKDGEFKLDPSIQKNYPMLYKYLSTQIEKDVMNSSTIKDAYKGLISGLTDANIQEQFTNNSGASLQVWDYPGQQSACGYTQPDEPTIEIASALFKNAENILADKGNKYTADEKQEALTLLYAVILHETGHELLKGREAGGDGKKYLNSGEIGYDLERYIFGLSRGHKPENANKEQVVQGPTSGNDKLKKGVIKGVVENAKTTEAGKATLPTVPTKEKKTSDKKTTKGG